MAIALGAILVEAVDPFLYLALSAGLMINLGFSLAGVFVGFIDIRPLQMPFYSVTPYAELFGQKSRTYSMLVFVDDGLKLLGGEFRSSHAISVPHKRAGVKSTPVHIGFLCTFRATRQVPQEVMLHEQGSTPGPRLTSYDNMTV
jgi:hypothetical protein